MALVLRKAVLPRNLSLIKCIKGRNLASAANKKTPTPISTAAACWSLKERKFRPYAIPRLEKTKQAPAARSNRQRKRAPALRISISCPELVSAAKSKIRVPLRHFSPPQIRSMSYRASSVSLPVSKYILPLMQHSPLMISKRAYSKCACPGPCGPCCCGCNLPPPCNTPPRCLQYMTGYYYYPYGFWFCGPYHVQGTCTPIGPCGPGGPCGPCCKVCPPCCMVPGVPGIPAAAAVPAAAGPELAPQPADCKPRERTGIVPGNVIQTPLKEPPAPPPSTAATSAQQHSRPGISKFFPFSSVSPPFHTTACPKLPHTPNMSTMSYSIPQEPSSKARKELSWSTFTDVPKFNSSPSKRSNSQYARYSPDASVKLNSPIHHKRYPAKRYIYHPYAPFNDNYKSSFSRTSPGSHYDYTSYKT